MQVSVEGQKNLEKELASSLKREAILQNLMKEMRSKLLNFQKEQALKPSDSTETLPAEVKVESDFVEKVAVDEGKSERVANLEMELQACITEIENLKDSHKKEVAELIHVGNLQIGHLNGQTETINQLETEVLYLLKNPYKLLLSSDPLSVNRSHWLANSSTDKCTEFSCNLPFGIMNRKHHCRKCGGIFCYSHLEKVKLSPLEKKRDPDGIATKLCQSCVALIDGRAEVFQSFEEAVIASR